MNLNQLPSKGNVFEPGISLIGSVCCSSLFAFFVSLCSIGQIAADLTRRCNLDNKHKPLVSQMRDLVCIMFYRISLDFVVLQNTHSICCELSDLIRLSIQRLLYMRLHLRHHLHSEIYETVSLDKYISEY